MTPALRPNNNFWCFVHDVVIKTGIELRAIYVEVGYLQSQQ